MIFDVEFHHNVSCIANGELSIFNRAGQPVVQPGDTFTYVCTIQLEAESAEVARDRAFAAGNLPYVPGARSTTATPTGA